MPDDNFKKLPKFGKKIRTDIFQTKVRARARQIIWNDCKRERKSFNRCQWWWKVKKKIPILNFSLFSHLTLPFSLPFPAHTTLGREFSQIKKNWEKNFFVSQKNGWKKMWWYNREGVPDHEIKEKSWRTFFLQNFKDFW